MIDLHFHLLPGIDDGPATIADALALARMSADQGISMIACTPHLLAGVYETAGPVVREATARMQTELDDRGIDIRLVVGTDLHICPDNISSLKSGRALALNDSRYVLIEMPHSFLPPRMDHALFDMMAAGYVPVLTHPERMGWIDREYAFVRRLAQAGVKMQITAGALTGAFGRTARHWSERMLDDGLVDLVASDAHDAKNRPPLLAEAYEIVSRRAGSERAWHIFVDVPEAILADEPLPDAPAVERPGEASRQGLGFLASARSFLTWSRHRSPASHG